MRDCVRRATYCIRERSRALRGEHAPKVRRVPLARVAAAPVGKEARVPLALARRLVARRDAGQCERRARQHELREERERVQRERNRHTQLGRVHGLLELHLDALPGRLRRSRELLRPV